MIYTGYRQLTLIHEKLKLVFFISIFILSCNPKTEIVQPIESPCSFDCDDISKLEVVWSVPINSLEDNFTHLTPFIYGSSVIIGATPSKTSNEVIYSFDILNGNKNWEWKDYFNGENPTKKIYVYNNLGAFSNWYRDYVIDLNSGTSLWKYETPLGVESISKSSLIGSMIYHPTDVEGHAVDSIAHMQRTSIFSPSWEIVFTMKKDSTLTDVNFEPPSLWIAQNGDSILIFQRRSYNWKFQYDYQDLIAFNLKNRNIQWKISNMGGSDFSSTHPILISENMAYFFGSEKTFAIDLLTGNILWSSSGVTSNSNGLTNASCLILGDKLVIKTDDKYIYALDKKSGKLKWFREVDMGWITGSLVYSMDKIYLQIYERLICIDANTGKLIFKYRSPNAKRKDKSAEYSGVGGAAIDPVRKLIFIADSYYLNCMKIPD